MASLIPYRLTGSDVEVYGETPTSTTERGKSQGQLVLMCDYANRYAYRDLILPSPDMNGQFVNIPPAFAFPGDSNMVAKSVQIKPAGTQTSNTFPPTWTKAILTINYETMDFFQSTSQFQPNGPGGATSISSKTSFMSHEVNISGDFLSWPSSACTYGANADPSSAATSGQQRKVPEDQHSAIVIPSLEHKITWHYVPYPPWAAMRWLVGNVNAYWFEGCAPETLLFLGCNAKREMSSSGVQLYTLEYKFNEKNMNQLDPYNAFGWNHYLRVNGYNAGSFQIVDRKTPKGTTTLDEFLFNADTTMTVKSRSSFPATKQPGMYIQIEDEIIDVGSDMSTNEWTISGRGQFGTTMVEHDDSTELSSIIAARLGVNVDATTRNWKVGTSPSVFPQVGQFFMEVEDEKVVVSRRFRSDQTSFYVLRGVRGTTAESHVGGTLVKMGNSPMFPMGDFKFLFQSGLQFS